MADTTDLLHISDTLDEINGESVGENPDYGMNYTYLYIGMSGQRMVDKMNENWHATDAEFLALATALGNKIKSLQIKEIKVENNVVYYTTNGTTWNSLQASWGSITGNLANQTDLANALSSKVGSDVFDLLEDRVEVVEGNISDINTTIGGIQEDVSTINSEIESSGGILSRLNAAESDLNTKISSPTVIAIRTTSGTSLEFTTDGENWHPVSSAGIIEWGQIEGNISEQSDLALLFSNIDDSLSGLSGDLGDLDTALSNHTSNTNNPHSVTKAQVGLENVDNTSDLNKPVSTAQQDAIDLAAQNAVSQATTAAVNAVKFKSLTQAEYNALATKDSTTFYFINDL